MYKPTFTTMGQSSPASVAEDARDAAEGDGYYRWRKTPGWTPGCDREAGDGQPHQPNAKAIASRAERIDKYCELRAADKDMKDADSRKAAERLLGIGRSAGKDYEREYQRRQQESAQ